MKQRENILIECVCGCGEKRNKYDKRGRKRKYIYGHANRGRKFPNLKHDKQFKKGQVPHNKGDSEFGKKYGFKKGHEVPQEWRDKWAEKNRGKEPWNKGLKGYKAGEEHYNWNGGITKEGKADRIKFNQEIQPKVFERDEYTCQKCGQVGGVLHVDHIKGWSQHPDKRFNMENCQTLCVDCHYYKTFGKKRPEDSTWGEVGISS